MTPFPFPVHEAPSPHERSISVMSLCPSPIVLTFIGPIFSSTQLKKSHFLLWFYWLV